MSRNTVLIIAFTPPEGEESKLDSGVSEDVLFALRFWEGWNIEVAGEMIIDEESGETYPPGYPPGFLK